MNDKDIHMTALILYFASIFSPYFISQNITYLLLYKITFITLLSLLIHRLYTQLPSIFSNIHINIILFMIIGFMGIFYYNLRNEIYEIRKNDKFFSLSLAYLACIILFSTFNKIKHNDLIQILFVSNLLFTVAIIVTALKYDFKPLIYIYFLYYTMMAVFLSCLVYLCYDFNCDYPVLEFFVFIAGSDVYLLCLKMYFIDHIRECVDFI